MRVVLVSLSVGLLLVWAAHAAVPLTVNHQGHVRVDGVPFTGTGYFRFGFYGAGNTWLWTNDGTRIGVGIGTPPDAAIALDTVRGTYNVRLGDIALPAMAPLPSTVFDGDDVKLRVMFDDGANGLQVLLPDQPLSSAPYAVHAATADHATTADTAASATTAEGVPELQAQVDEVCTLIGLNAIRQMQNRAVDWSSGQIDGWAEAYTDADGQGGSVDLEATNSYWYPQAGVYLAGSPGVAGAIHNPTGFESPSLAFDDDVSTQARCSISQSSAGSLHSLGLTFPETYVSYARVVANASFYGGEYGDGVSLLKLQGFDGSTWTDLEILDSQNAPAYNNIYVGYSGAIAVNAALQGVRVVLDLRQSESSGKYSSVYELSYSTSGTSSEIHHNLPAGTFAPNISQAIGVAMIDDWDGEDSNIQFKLTNTAGDDSGWLDVMNPSPRFQSFTAFTSEPEKVIVRLVPKTNAPTGGMPSIKGFWGRTSAGAP